MGRIEDMRNILHSVGLPPRQQNDMCCLVMLAMAGVGAGDEMAKATNEWIRIHDIMAFMKSEYDVSYAENTRETVRKNAIHPFRIAALIEDEGRDTNNPYYRYRITEEFLRVIRNDGSAAAVGEFMDSHESLKQMYASKKVMRKMPVKINDRDFTFSPGKHNRLQKAILEEFAPRFAPGAQCLYVGDTTNRDMVKDAGKLAQLGFEITLHDKMPDVVLYCEDKDWLFFIEAVTSDGPMSPKRLIEIEEMTRNVTSGKVYVTAFLDCTKYKRFAHKLAWETEVWIAAAPDHMIHLNGDKFMGPRQ